MNNYILINRTFSETTPESSEIGDFSDQGMIEENKKVTFGELVKLMQEHPHASASGNPPVAPTIDIWYTTTAFTRDFRTNTEREESIHYSHENTPNAAKYWILAANTASKPRN